MILASKILFNSFLTSGSNFIFIFLSSCWYGFAFGSKRMTCWIILVSYILISSYIHANMSLYCLNNFIKESHSDAEHLSIKFIFLGCCSKPKLITSYCMVELWILEFVILLIFLYKSYSCSILTTNVWMVLEWYSPMSNDFLLIASSCSPSSIIWYLSLGSYYIN